MEEITDDDARILPAVDAFKEVLPKPPLESMAIIEKEIGQVNVKVNDPDAEYLGQT